MKKQRTDGRFVIAGCTTAATHYLRSIGYSAVASGSILTAYSTAGIVGACASGWLANRLRLNHSRFLLLSLALMAILTVLFSMQTGYVELLGIGLLYGAISFMPGTHFTALAMKTAGRQYAATAAASLNLFMQAASMVQPLVTGPMLDAGLADASIWPVFIAAAGIAFLLCLPGACDKSKAHLSS